MTQNSGPIFSSNLQNISMFFSKFSTIVTRDSVRLVENCGSVAGNIVKSHTYLAIFPVEIQKKVKC